MHPLRRFLPALASALLAVAAALPPSVALAQSVLELPGTPPTPNTSSRETQAEPIAAEPGVAAEGWQRYLSLDHLPFIPIPEVSTSPHSGVNLGLFPVILLNNSKGEVDTIYAPDVVHSQYFGWGARWRTFRNVSDDEKWSLIVGGKQFVEREFDFEYDLGLQRADHWSWIMHAMYDRNGNGRFYGFGNNSRLGGQSTYINAQMRVEMTAARNFSRAWQLAYLVRADSAEIETSALNSLPATEALYPNLPGLGDASELHQRFLLSYDTRDDLVSPHVGERIVAFAGITTRALGSSVDYTVYGLDLTHFEPLSPTLTLAAHAALRFMPTYTNAPFWAYSRLGGETNLVAESQPLRAFGEGRFIDRNSFSSSIEARQMLRNLHMFDTDLKLEVAPFVDAGRVFRDMMGNPLSSLHVGAGLGLRVHAGPFVVGYLDMAYGTEKMAIFTGIDYPF